MSRLCITSDDLAIAAANALAVRASRLLLVGAFVVVLLVVLVVVVLAARMAGAVILVVIDLLGSGNSSLGALGDLQIGEQLRGGRVGLFEFGEVEIA